MTTFDLVIATILIVFVVVSIIIGVKSDDERAGFRCFGLLAAIPAGLWCIMRLWQYAT